jgi:nucleoside-diphosphate-sugar epimerase
LLRDGYKVIGIDCFTDYYPREIKEANISNAMNYNNFKLIEENILKMDKFPEVDYVFHLAAQAGVRASWGKSFEIYTRNNIEATQKLLEFYKNRKTRDFTYVDDAVEATILAADNNLVGEVFNIGGGSRMSVNELIKWIEEFTGREARLKYIEEQKGDVRDTLADTGKIRVLGWKPQVKIEEGLKRFVEWYKKR